MSRQLPSLNALRAFEAAARHMSFTLAAEELCVTQGAISRQIKLLEGHLKVPLFRRGYADSIARRKASTSTVTVLDANRDQLQSQLSERPSL